MLDSDIIKALECCKYDDCNNCPNVSDNCHANLIDYALALINRQKAEIERLMPYNTQVEASKKLEKEIKAEAIKEFVERLKNKLTSCSKAIDGKSEYLVCDFDIDSLVKEMVGE